MVSPMAMAILSCSLAKTTVHPFDHLLTGWGLLLAGLSFVNHARCLDAIGVPAFCDTSVTGSSTREDVRGCPQASAVIQRLPVYSEPQVLHHDSSTPGSVSRA